MNARQRDCWSSALVALALSCASCDTSPPGHSEEPATHARPSTEQLMNATYAGVYDVPVRLSSGRFEGEPFQPGAASRPTLILILDHVAFDDLDGDGAEEAAVLLVESSGGSGSFVYLAIVALRDGGPDNVATTLIGDRVTVASIDTGDSSVFLRVVPRQPGHPPGRSPREIVREWELRDGVLVERKIRFDLTSIDKDGLIGPADGKRALSYEFCVPNAPEYLDEIASVDPSAEAQRAKGRIGCTTDEVLFIGSTHQPDYLEVLETLASRPYIERIEQAFFE